MQLPALTIFDLETTGLDPNKGHKIIEVAGVRLENGVINEESAFVELVNPERDVPWEAKQVNKIDDEQLVGAPTIDAVLPQFLDFAQGSLLVAHNASFDMGFMEVEKECCWGYVDLPECLCTLQLSRNVHPQESYHNLDAVGTRLGLELPEARHRALPDVLLTAQALLKLIELGNISDIDQLRRLAGVRQMAA